VRKKENIYVQQIALGWSKIFYMTIG